MGLWRMLAPWRLEQVVGSKIQDKGAGTNLARIRATGEVCGISVWPNTYRKSITKKIGVDGLAGIRIRGTSAEELAKSIARVLAWAFYWWKLDVGATSKWLRWWSPLTGSWCRMLEAYCCRRGEQALLRMAWDVWRESRSEILVHLVGIECVKARLVELDVKIVNKRSTCSRLVFISLFTWFTMQIFLILCGII